MTTMEFDISLETRFSSLTKTYVFIESNCQRSCVSLEYRITCVS